MTNMVQAGVHFVVQEAIEIWTDLPPHEVPDGLIVEVVLLDRPVFQLAGIRITPGHGFPGCEQNPGFWNIETHAHGVAVPIATNNSTICTV